MLKARVHAQVIQVVEIPRPPRALIDLLQGDDIGRDPVEQPRNLAQVDAKFPLAREPLDRREAATMGDVESDETQARHVEAQWNAPSAPQRQSRELGVDSRKGGPDFPRPSRRS